jgi:hypothetical protein
MKARGLPQILQRLCACALKRGGRVALAIIDFLANAISVIDSCSPNRLIL